MVMHSRRTTDVSRIHGLIESWARSVREQDLDGILAGHSPDIVMFDVLPPLQIRGIRDYKRSWDQFFAAFVGPVAFDLSEIEITAGKDVAFGHGLVRCAGVEAKGGQLDIAVRVTVGLRKIDGEWTVVHEHHSEPSAVN